MNTLTNPTLENLWSEELEQIVLGSLMIDPTMLANIETIIRDEHTFFLVKHRYIYLAVRHVIRTTEQCTIELTAQRLHNNNQLKLVGGAAYLSKLVAETPTSIHAPIYAGLLKTFAQRRLLVEASNNILELANSNTISINDALAQSMQSIRSIIEHSADNSLTLQQRYEDYLNLISATEDKRYIPSP